MQHQEFNTTQYAQTQQKILTELKTLDTKDFETKKEYIMRLKQVTRPLIESGYYQGKRLDDLAVIVYGLLEKYEVSYPRNDSFYSLFANDEKREEKNSNLSTSSRQKISSLPIEKKTGDESVDKLRLVIRNGYHIPEDYKFGRYLKLIILCNAELAKQSNSILKRLGNAISYVNAFAKEFQTEDNFQSLLQKSTGKTKRQYSEVWDYYQLSKQTILSIESAIGDVLPKIKNLEDTLAEQKHTSNKLDQRNKITFLEKWNAILLSKVRFNMSHVAKLLDIDKKHINNNILPTKNPVTSTQNKHHNYIDWFRAIQVTSPSGEEFTFDAKDYFDRQIERSKLNLEYEPIVLSNCTIND